MTASRPLRCLLLAAVLAGSGACAATAPHPDDPLESVNRATHGFQTHVLDNIVDPVARGYRAVVPEPGRDRVRNVLENLERPTALVNHLLQAEPGEALSTAGAFLIDSTVGIAGIFRPAEDIGVADRDTRFGDTLGVWGAGPGIYLVVPPFGGSDARTVTGQVVDSATNPARWVLGDGVRIALTATRVVDVSERTLDQRDAVKETADDPYAAFRARHVLRPQEVREQRGERRVEGAPD